MNHLRPAALLLALLILGGRVAPGPAAQDRGPVIHRLGTIDVGVVETTPFVFNERLYRFEWVRPEYEGNRQGSHYRILDALAGRVLSEFGHEHAFGCALVQDKTVWAFGVEKPGGSRIDAFWSKDLVKWESAPAVELKGWSLFNTSVCKDGDGFLMAVEVGGPPEVAGTPFTSRFLRSRDLKTWELVPEPAVFTKDRYSACPTVRFFDGIYYLIYLEKTGDWEFQSYIARSRDLVRWELSPRNPFLKADEADRRISNPKLSEAQRRKVAEAQDLNNSDVDLCEFEGKVVIHYSWGNQKGTEFLGQAECQGTLRQFLAGWFPE